MDYRQQICTFSRQEIETIVNGWLEMLQNAKQAEVEAFARYMRSGDESARLAHQYSLSTVGTLQRVFSDLGIDCEAV